MRLRNRTRIAATIGLSALGLHGCLVSISDFEPTPDFGDASTGEGGRDASSSTSGGVGASAEASTEAGTGGSGGALADASLDARDAPGDARPEGSPEAAPAPDAGTDAGDSGSPPAAACVPASPTGATDAGATYLFCQPLAGERLSWFAAATICASRGLQIAVVNDQEENDWIATTMTANGIATAWLGGSDRHDEGQWHWADGRRFWNVNQPAPGAFTHWSTGEPNDEEHQSFLSIGADGLWSDTSGLTSLAGTVCEPRPADPCEAESYGGNDYVFCSEGVTDKTWAAASLACAARGMRLARIDDAAENAALVAALPAHNLTAAWFGAFEAGENGRWTWEDGDQVWTGGAAPAGLPVLATYAGWSATEPVNVTGLESVGVLQTDGTWHAAANGATGPNGWVCERYADDACALQVRGSDAYLFCHGSDAASWADARTDCSARSAHLVRVDSQVENDWIRDVGSALEHFPAFLGCSDVATEGSWVWRDGTQFWEVGTGAVGGLFNAFDVGEPSGGAGEDFCEMRGTGFWKDATSAYQLPAWTCEVDAPASCAAILAADPSARDGAYFLDPDAAGPEVPFEAWCDMTTAGGGWTLVTVNGTNGRPTAWTGNAYPRPGASRYGRLGVAVADVRSLQAGATTAANYSIDAAALFAISTGDILVFVGGSTADYVTTTLPHDCNFFDGSTICVENTYTGLKVRDSVGNVITTAAQACTTAHGQAPWTTDPYDEFGLHLLDGLDDWPSHNCLQNSTSELGTYRGRIYSTFESSTTVTYWSDGVTQHWKELSASALPGYLLLR